MPIAHLNTLVILQVGALLGLAAWFLLEALRRGDPVLRRMALSALLAAVGTLLEHAGGRWVPWLAGLMGMGAYLLLLLAFMRAYPGRLHRRTPRLVLLALASGVLIVGVGGGDAPVSRLLPALGQLAAAGVGAWVLWIILRLRREGTCGSAWMVPLVWVAFVLLVAHAFARPYIGAVLAMDDSALLLLLLALGLGHLKDEGRHLQQRADHLETEVLAWRSLLKGPSWRTGEPAEAMVERFGSRWTSQRGDTLVSLDGAPHHVHRVPLPDGAEVGWAEPLLPTREEVLPFLKGWIVGLGMEEGPVRDQHRAKLEEWGAVVTPIDSVPPREAPYPNLILWAREPSILAVWRELDLGRRRCRWVQIGGTDLEGPHARLERDCSERELREVLRSLVSPGPRPGRA